VCNCRFDIEKVRELAKKYQNMERLDVVIYETFNGFQFVSFKKEVPKLNFKIVEILIYK